MAPPSNSSAESGRSAGARASAGMADLAGVAIEPAGPRPLKLGRRRMEGLANHRGATEREEPWIRCAGQCQRGHPRFGVAIPALGVRRADEAVRRRRGHHRGRLRAALPDRARRRGEGDFRPPRHGNSTPACAGRSSNASPASANARSAAAPPHRLTGQRFWIANEAMRRRRRPTRSGRGGRSCAHHRLTGQRLRIAAKQCVAGVGCPMGVRAARRAIGSGSQTKQCDAGVGSVIGVRAWNAARAAPPAQSSPGVQPQKVGAPWVQIGAWVCTPPGGAMQSKPGVQPQEGGESLVQTVAAVCSVPPGWPATRGQSGVCMPVQCGHRVAAVAHANGNVGSRASRAPPAQPYWVQPKLGGSTPHMTGWVRLGGGQMKQWVAGVGVGAIAAACGPHRFTALGVGTKAAARTPPPAQSSPGVQPQKVGGPWCRPAHGFGGRPEAPCSRSPACSRRTSRCPAYTGNVFAAAQARRRAPSREHQSAARRCS